MHSIDYKIGKDLLELSGIAVYRWQSGRQLQFKFHLVHMHLMFHNCDRVCNNAVYVNNFKLGSLRQSRESEEILHDIFAPSGLFFYFRKVAFIVGQFGPDRVGALQLRG